MTAGLYRVHIGYTITGRDRWRCFATLEQAREFCDSVFRATKIVLTIIED